MRIVKLDNGRTKIDMQEFDDINDFNEYIGKAPVNKAFEGRKENLSSERTEASTAAWSGTSSLDEARKLLREGWSEGADKIAKAIQVDKVPHAVMRSTPAYGMVGGQASVPRYIQGIPTNMVDRKNVQQKQKIIVINREISVVGGVTSGEMMIEGIKAMQIVQALEGKGFRVKLNLTSASTAGGNNNVALRITVKKPEERLSLLKVAFPLAHTSMLRRIEFSWMERSEIVYNRSYLKGYGQPNGERLKALLPQGEVFLPARIGNVDAFIASLKL